MSGTPDPTGPILRAQAALVVSLLLACPARATVPEKVGAGAASMALGGTGVAWTRDGYAAYLNPAGLSRMRRPEAGLGLSAMAERFTPLPDVWWDTNRDGAIDRRDPPLALPSDVEDAIGVHLFAGRHVGGKFGIGVMGYFPTRRLIEVRTTEPDLPQYFLYGSRVQRYVLAAGIGGQIVRGVHIGAGVDFVPRVRVDVALTLDTVARTDGQGDDLGDLVTEVVVDLHELDLELIAGFAPTLGLQLDLGAWSDALEGLSVGVAWRGAVGLPVQSTFDAQVNLSVEDVGDLEPYVLAIVAITGLDLFDHYVPMTLAGGLAWRPPGRVGASVDLRWTDWRPMLLSVARLADAEITSPLIRIDDRIVDGNAYSATFRPTVSVHAGLEFPLPRIDAGERWRYLDVALRCGAGWVPSPLVSQGPSSALLDTGRGLLSAGIGAETWDPFALIDGAVRFDAVAQLHLLAPTRLPRASPTPRSGYPVDGDGIPIGGHIWVFGAQWGFQF